MLEKSRENHLGSDPSGSQQESEISSPSVDEDLCLSDFGFEDISNTIEDRISKRL